MAKFEIAKSRINCKKRTPKDYKSVGFLKKNGLQVYSYFKYFRISILVI